MIAEALRYLRDMADQAATPKPLETGDPRVKTWAVGGAELSFPLPAPPRAHHFGTLDDLIELANRFAKVDGSSPVAWFHESAVVLVIDDAGHRIETATLPLVTSDLFARLIELRAKRQWFDHKSFVRLLKVELAGALAESELLAIVRKIKFENGQTVTAEVSRQKESLGKSITAAVSGEKDIPDQVTPQVPLYKTAGERETYAVRCTVEVDPGLGTFQLLPMPDEIERVQQQAMADVRDRLHDGLEKGVPAYYGKP